MAINADTEIMHELLGPIRYDDGQPLDRLNGYSKSTTPMWVARPHGWDGDLEFYLACGDGNSPNSTSLRRAVTLFTDYGRILEIARQMTSQKTNISWFDCTATATTIALTDPDDDAYIRWMAVLDIDGNPIEITEGAW